MYASPVSIIIPNYNGEHILERSLMDVVEAVNAYPQACEIIVVDDASRDNSCQLLAEKFPQIHVVRHQVNKGFTEAVHSGVAASTYPILVLLNTDVFPDRNFMAPLIRWFNRADTFCVSPLITDGDGHPSRVSWNTGKIARGEIRKRKWDLDHALKCSHQGKALQSLFAQGGAAAVRKEMFLQLGGFLSIYKPFYYEDCDLCTRAWQRGWKTYFEPASTVIHDHQQGTITRFFDTRKIKIIKKRNRLFYLWLHLSMPTLIFSHFPWVLLRLLGRLLKLDLVFVMGFFAALPALGRVMTLRRKLERQHQALSLEDLISRIG